MSSPPTLALYHPPLPAGPAGGRGHDVRLRFDIHIIIHVVVCPSAPAPPPSPPKPPPWWHEFIPLLIKAAGYLALATIL